MKDLFMKTFILQNSCKTGITLVAFVQASTDVIIHTFILVQIIYKITWISTKYEQHTQNNGEYSSHHCRRIQTKLNQYCH